MEDRAGNGSRFDGLADLYNEARPHVPEYPVRILSQYLGRKPRRVVDLGCGPGISTMVWQGKCDEAIGIEPNADMVRVAQQKAGEGMRFCRAYGNDTGLEDECADIVVSSQAFHWMEPESTLAEINRILVPGGVFSTIDYEWPPSSGWKAELAFAEFGRKMAAIDPEGPKQGIVRWSKKDHLKHIREYGHFVYTRELFFASEEECSAKRLLNMAMSRSSTQYILRHHPQEAEPLMREFLQEAEEILGKGTSFTAQISYRMRMGIKGEAE